MFTKNKLCIFCCICIIFLGCNSGNKKITLKFVTVSSSLYAPDSSYTEDRLAWKKYYEQCIKSDLFPDAFYLQLQDKVYIGSINNEHEIDVNKGINILDTGNGKSIFNVMYIVNSSNCDDTIHLSEKLRNGFLREVENGLINSPEYKNSAPVGVRANG